VALLSPMLRKDLLSFFSVFFRPKGEAAGFPEKLVTLYVTIRHHILKKQKLLYNNNNNHLLRLNCHPVAMVILHVHKI